LQHASEATVAITQDALEQALSMYLSCGPFADPDFLDYDAKQKRWGDWLSQLTGQDIPVIVEAAVEQIEATGSFDTADPWLLKLLECLENSGRHAPDSYLEYAEQYRRSPHRTIFLSTVGALFLKDGLDWLRDVQEREDLNETELRLLVDAYLTNCSETGMVGLDRLICSVPAENVELHALIARARQTLSEVLADYYDQNDRPGEP
jgi:hypothetical protein